MLNSTKPKKDDHEEGAGVFSLPPSRTLHLYSRFEYEYFSESPPRTTI
ncbi:hypothetical protein J2129_000977 [Methanofollis sp. W23]|nr:hypothetical protein [Methanofollis sp. W23]